MALAAFELLGVFVTNGHTAAAAFDRLAVDADRVAGLMGFLLATDAFAESVGDILSAAVVTPATEVFPDGSRGLKVLGHEMPLTTGKQNVEDGIDGVTYGGLAGVGRRWKVGSVA